LSVWFSRLRHSLSAVVAAAAAAAVVVTAAATAAAAVAADDATNVTQAEASVLPDHDLQAIVEPF